MSQRIAFLLLEVAVFLKKVDFLMMPVWSAWIPLLKILYQQELKVIDKNGPSFSIKNSF